MSVRGLRNLLITVGIVAGLGGPVLADNYQVDPVHSGVFFRIKHLNIGYAYGRVNDLTGQVVWDDQNPNNNSIQLALKADSIDTGNAKRDGHLKGPDFFNTKEFPNITFQSKQIKMLEPNKYEVIGDLNLHGVTQPITVKLQKVGAGNDPFGGYRAGFEGTVTLKRSDFGMNYMPQALDDNIWLMIGFEAVKAKQ